MKYKNLNLKYALINCFYFFLVCGTAGFANNYLQYKGLDTSVIGILLTLVNVIALIGQTTMAPIVDKSKKWNEKKYILFTLAIAIVCYALMMFIPGESAFMMVLAVVGFACASIGIPYLNSIAFIYEKVGFKINYGLGRGVGSAAYAIAALIIGQLINFKDASILPIWLLVMAVLDVIVIATLQVPEDEEETKEVKEESKVSYTAFFKKYSNIMLVVLALILLFFTHMLINNYMINIVEAIGGDAGSQGTATFIQALVELPPMFAFVYLLKKFRIDTLMIVAAISWAIKDILILIAPNMTVYYFAMVLQMFSYAIAVPASVYFADQYIDSEDRNQGQTIMGAAGTIGGLLASFIGGILLSVLSVRATLYVGMAVAVLGAILMVVGVHNLRKTK
jgi:MFS transporter, PPP family, 3-phenylpropionic acid transporter